ncbi:MAG: phosphoribosylamine--glycine ligase, partial [Acidobacteria bacterium]|nr:phosphoribosylamine--glycine ligase [Acidobacteriota bacterium]
MNILIIGSGGREHALVWKLKQSQLASEIFWAPGNGGAEGYAKTVSINSEDIISIVNFCSDSKIDFVVVGPEAPLALGIVDELQRKGIKAFGPSKYASQLESSKVFAKLFCKNHNIPSANFWIFEDFQKATDFLKGKEAKYPIVLKADGLAAGKGVIIAEDEAQAVEGVKKIMVHKEFGEAGRNLLIEEFLIGEEISLMAICDGEKSLLLPTARDYKRALNGDKGGNTGGMGAMS